MSTSFFVHVHDGPSGNDRPAKGPNGKALKGMSLEKAVALVAKWQAKQAEKRARGLPTRHTYSIRSKASPSGGGIRLTVS